MKKSFIYCLLSLIALSLGAQTANIINIPDVRVSLGAVQLPVNINNTDEIVAAQFDITLPDGVTAETTVALTNRTNGHTATAQNMGNGIYRVLLFAQPTKSLFGQSGTVMNIPLNIPDSFVEGSVHTLAISNAVLTNRSGANVLTQATAGNITVSKLPDLVVKNITCSSQTMSPGDRIVASWQVENIGELATGGGWSEQVSLVSEDGTQSKLIATTHYNEILEANGIVSRQVEITLPFLLGIDGKARLQISVVPNSNTGESTSAQGNNTQIAPNSLYINKVLSFELSQKRLEESNSSRISFKLNRSGSWQKEETFVISATKDSRISVPANITIPANQSGAIVYLNVIDNDVFDNDSLFIISAEGNGYEKVSSQLIIEDDEYPSLELTTTKNILTEGETFQLTITTSRVSSQPITVTLTSEISKQFSFPSAVVIPAGETSVTVDVTAIDDELPGLDISNAFTASTSKYNSAEVLLFLKDNDLPVLELKLTPSTVSEGIGVVAVAGVLRRTTNTNSKITVKLSDDANGGLYFGNRTLELAKGVEEVHFNFGPVDNAQVDGDRTYTVTASVWISSCSCSAAGESAGSVTAQLKVLDDDGPALNLASSLSTVKEGETTTLIINRNTTDTPQPLTVTLSSDYDEGLVYDHIVTIPAGKQSVAVEVKSTSNDVQGDSHIVIFTVQAEGYAKGTCYVMVTDQTLPDARISNIMADVTEAEVGTKAMLTIVVINEGAAELPAEVPVKIYRRGDSNAVGSIYTSEIIPVGGSQTLTKTIILPTIVSTQKYYAVVNESNKIQELSYNNNTSTDVEIATIAPFTIAINTDKSVYKQGEKILITGQLTGNSISETDIDIYLINEGARQVQTVKTDAQGAFTYEWQLYDLQSGHFAAGACYPGEGSKEEMASFDVYGLRRTDKSYITNEVGLGEIATGHVGFYNPGNHALSGVKAEIISSPENCEVSVKIPSEVSGGATVQMLYSLKGLAASENLEWSEVIVRLTSDEGITCNAILYFYCYNWRAQLSSNYTHIDATITKGSTREFPLQIVNTGKGATGEVRLSLPEWMNCQSGTILPSMEYNDTTTIVLLMKTNDRMQLNMPVTGTFGINCANGNGLTINYSVEPVSEEKGLLQVDACDEYTYNTVEAPHVAGAQVIIKHPYTEAEIARGTTDEKGLFEIQLPEGYYKVEVSSEKHNSYTNYCNVNPGKIEYLVANISYQPITILWTVEETEVEDEYEIVTSVRYETNVPMPVVKVEIPKSIDGDNMAVGDAVMINMKLTNVGLIKADNIKTLYPKDMTEWEFEVFADDGFTLNPQQSVVIPIRITRVEDSSRMDIHVRKKNAAEDLINSYRDCMAGLGARYEWLCGDDIKNNEAAERMAMKICAISATLQAIGNIFSGLGSGPGGPSGGSGGSGDGTTKYNEVTKTLDICDPCDAARMEAIINSALGFTWFGPINSAFTDATEAAQIERKTGNYPGKKWLIKKLGGKVFDAATGAALDVKLFKGASKFWKLGDGVYEVITACGKINKASKKGNRQNVSSHSWVNEFDEIALRYLAQLDVMESIIHYTFGDSIWCVDIDEQKLDFINYVCNLPDDVIPTEEELLARKPESVTTAQMRSYVNYVYGTDSESPSLEEIEEKMDVFTQMNEEAKARGYDSMTDEFYAAWESYCKQYEEMASSSVCASITLQFKQTMTMTRQAFRGKLIVYNGHGDTPMTDVKLSLKVIDQNGRLASSHEFQINPESLNGFSGDLDLGSGWTLGPNETGTATILFIPTKYAAPTEPVDWSFGGTLSYIDPYTGLEVTRELYPVTLTVKPSPELELTYFMQRDVYGDDPLTRDVVEPMEPAEFALIINNKGYGDANKVRMQTEQPKIIENEKGLYIDFNIKSSQVNGNPASLSFSKTILNDFGDIPAHSQAYGQWWLESSLLGHFTSYVVEATHVTSYDNKDLSLLDTVTIHEMIHGFTVHHDGNIPLRGYLVNDIADAEDMPDMLYFTDATQQNVYVAKELNIIKKNNTEYVLTVKVDNAGWYYGSLPDPTYGKQKLVKVTRADGTEVNVDNIWQTDRTLRDGKDWLYEYRLHFVGDMSTEGEAFHLTFEPKPELELAVESYAGAPKEGTVLKQQLTELTVKFNKPIKAETFTTEDITINCQGVKLAASQIVIQKLSDQEFKLILNEVTLGDGFYVLTIQTSGIEDADGFIGSNGKQTSWIQFADGMVALKVTVSPTEGGTVTPGSGRFNYDSDVMLKAIPAEGYDFMKWMYGDKTVSVNPDFVYHIYDNTELTALFTKQHFNVTISYDTAQGLVDGAATGIYDYGTELLLVAVPNEGYDFDAWMIDAERDNQTNPYVLFVNKNMNVNALFKEASTGIRDVETDALKVSISPLPLRDIMYITGNFKEVRNLSIYNMLGTKMLSVNKVHLDQGINVGKLNAGIYYLQIVTDRGVYRTKILKR